MPQYPRPEHQRLYKRKAWCGKPNGLRWRTLARDLFICQACGWQAKPNETSNLHCDHIKPHKGNTDLFFDPANVRTLCSNCHNADKQQQERIGYSTRIGLDGFPIDSAHPAITGKPIKRPSWQGPMSHPAWFRQAKAPLTIVCGPPASGKSTYVSAHAGQRDAVIDVDAICIKAFGKPAALCGASQLADAIRIRNEKLGDIMRPRTRHPPMTWLIVSAPHSDDRQWWADRLKPQQIIVMATPEDVCIARATKDSDRAKRQSPHTATAVANWWKHYTPRAGDTEISG